MLCFAGSLQHKDSLLPCTEIYYRRLVREFKVFRNYCFCGMIKVALEARRWNIFHNFLPEYFLSVTELWCLASSQFTLYVEFWPGQFYCVWRQKENFCYFVIYLYYQPSFARFLQLSLCHKATVRKKQKDPLGEWRTLFISIYHKGAEIAAEGFTWKSSIPISPEAKRRKRTTRKLYFFVLLSF